MTIYTAGDNMIIMGQTNEEAPFMEEMLGWVVNDEAALRNPNIAIVWEEESFILRWTHDSEGEPNWSTEAFLGMQRVHERMAEALWGIGASDISRNSIAGNRTGEAASELTWNLPSHVQSGIRAAVDTFHDGNVRDYIEGITSSDRTPPGGEILSGRYSRHENDGEATPETEAVDEMDPSWQQWIGEMEAEGVVDISYEVNFGMLIIRYLVSSNDSERIENAVRARLNAALEAMASVGTGAGPTSPTTNPEDNAIEFEYDQNRDGRGQHATAYMYWDLGGSLESGTTPYTITGEPPEMFPSPENTLMGISAFAEGVEYEFVQEEGGIYTVTISFDIPEEGRRNDVTLAVQRYLTECRGELPGVGADSQDAIVGSAGITRSTENGRMHVVLLWDDQAQNARFSEGRSGDRYMLTDHPSYLPDPHTMLSALVGNFYNVSFEWNNTETSNSLVIKHGRNDSGQRRRQGPYGGAIIAPYFEECRNILADHLSIDSEDVEETLAVENSASGNDYISHLIWPITNHDDSASSFEAEIVRRANIMQNELGDIGLEVDHTRWNGGMSFSIELTESRYERERLEQLSEDFLTAARLILRSQNIEGVNLETHSRDGVWYHNLTWTPPPTVGEPEVSRETMFGEGDRSTGGQPNLDDQLNVRLTQIISRMNHSLNEELGITAQPTFLDSGTLQLSHSLQADHSGLRGHAHNIVWQFIEEMERAAIDVLGIEEEQFNVEEQDTVSTKEYIVMWPSSAQLASGSEEASSGGPSDLDNQLNVRLTQIISRMNRELREELGITTEHAFTTAVFTNSLVMTHATQADHSGRRDRAHQIIWAFIEDMERAAIDVLGIREEQFDPQSEHTLSTTEYMITWPRSAQLASGPEEASSDPEQAVITDVMRTVIYEMARTSLAELERGNLSRTLSVTDSQVTLVTQPLRVSGPVHRIISDFVTAVRAYLAQQGVENSVDEQTYGEEYQEDSHRVIVISVNASERPEEAPSSTLGDQQSNQQRTVLERAIVGYDFEELQQAFHDIVGCGVANRTTESRVQFTWPKNKGVDIPVAIINHWAEALEVRLAPFERNVTVSPPEDRGLTNIITIEWNPIMNWEDAHSIVSSEGVEGWLRQIGADMDRSKFSIGENSSMMSTVTVAKTLETLQGWIESALDGLTLDVLRVDVSGNSLTVSYSGSRNDLKVVWGRIRNKTDQFEDQFEELVNTHGLEFPIDWDVVSATTEERVERYTLLNKNEESSRQAIRNNDFSKVSDSLMALQSKFAKTVNALGGKISISINGNGLEYSVSGNELDAVWLGFREATINLDGDFEDMGSGIDELKERFILNQ